MSNKTDIKTATKSSFCLDYTFKPNLKHNQHKIDHYNQPHALFQLLPICQRTSYTTMDVTDKIS